MNKLSSSRERAQPAQYEQLESAFPAGAGSFRMLFDASPTGMLLADAEGVWLEANPALCQAIGRDREELVGGAHPELFPPGYEQRRAEAREELSSAGIWRGEFPLLHADGHTVHFGWHAKVLPEGDLRLAVATDISWLKADQRLLQVRARQQRAVAELGELALREGDVRKLFDQATASITEILEIEYSKVLQLLPPGKEVLLRAGVGWKPGLVGTARIPAGVDSQASYTLHSDAPVVVADLREETRFRGPKLLTDHDVVSGMSCVIRRAEGRPWGVLGAHSRRHLHFTEDDVKFLMAVANILGNAIERQRAEQALRESEQRFHLVADAAPVLIWMSDSRKQGIYFNKRWLEFTGRAVEQELGDGWLEGIHPEDQERVAATCMGAFQRREEFRMEFRMRRADGQYRWVLDHGVPRFTEPGELAGYIGSCVDVTDRKEAREALEANEQRLRAVLDVLPLPLFIAEPSGRLQLTNRAADELWRTAPLSQRPDTYSEDYKAWWPTTGKRVESLEWGMARALEKGEIVTAEEMEIESHDGRRGTILNYARPIQDANGRITGGVAVNVDITARKRAEEALREADRKKDQFLATLAHELRNPLAPIRSGIEALRAGITDPQATGEVLAIMETQVRQLIRLIDDLMDASRITRGKLRLRKSRVDLAEIVNNAVEASRPLVDELHHSLAVSLPKKPIFLHADSARLAQVLSNLLNNAARYTEKGGQIRLMVQRQESELVISVKDTGRGIPADMRERIFEMFDQGQDPQQDGQTGLGIGLTLVKSLVEMHDGTVSVHSAGLNQGSDFFVRLPVDSSRAAEEGGTSGPPSGTESCLRRRVLIVDDNEPAARMLSIVIKTLGNDVRTAGDGPSALNAAAEFRPDVVLLDLGMPGMDGCEVAQRIRKEPWGKSVVLVALTGWGQDEDKRRTKEAGFNEHLVKPAEQAALKEVLARCGDPPS